jgi:four helix bundle protein
MDKDLEQRTKRFALAAIKLVGSLPRGLASDVLGRQLLRFATSIGANYREANRAVSRPDFTNKSGTSKHSNAADLYKESTELLAIFTTIGRKLKE